MITFLFTVAVVAVAIAAAVRTAVRDPDQPAMLREQPRRARPARRAPRRKAIHAPATVAVTEPKELAGGFSDQWIPIPAGLSVWVRVRSGFVLTVLLAVLGALVAVSISGLLLLIALAVRNAVG